MAKGGKDENKNNNKCLLIKINGKQKDFFLKETFLNGEIIINIFEVRRKKFVSFFLSFFKFKILQFL